MKKFIRYGLLALAIVLCLPILAACGEKEITADKAYTDSKAEYAAEGWTVEDIQSGVLTALSEAITTQLNVTAQLNMTITATKGFVATQDGQKIVVLYFAQETSAFDGKQGMTAFVDSAITEQILGGNAFGGGSGSATVKNLWMVCSSQEAAAIFYKYAEQVVKSSK